jgi:hypothetical protein
LLFPIKNSSPTSGFNMKLFFQLFKFKLSIKEIHPWST